MRATRFTSAGWNGAASPLLEGLTSTELNEDRFMNSQEFALSRAELQRLIPVENVPIDLMLTHPNLILYEKRSLSDFLEAEPDINFKVQH